MIQTALRYHRPTTPEAATQLLVEHEDDVAVLGGGTQLLPRMTRDEVSVGHIVDLQALDGAHAISADADRLRLGALVTYDDVLRSPDVALRLPHLARVASEVTGGRQLRSTGTIVGSACFAMPGSDMPAAIAGLGATLRIHGPGGWRDAPAREFFLAAFRPALAPGEFVHSADFPLLARSTGYCKVKHCSGSWPIATASAVRDSRSTRITLGAVQATPLTVELSDEAVSDRQALIDEVTAAITEPWSDPLAPGSYRARIAGIVAARAHDDMEGAT